ncbi:MAG TPA: hypothetical protein VMI55_05945 [Thermoplasmata archaeon]|nr:hypothetical protein [Thermoplasmata archaeon]
MREADPCLLPYYWRDNPGEPLDRARRRVLELRLARVILKALGPGFDPALLPLEGRRYNLSARTMAEARRRLNRRCAPDAGTTDGVSQ